LFEILEHTADIGFRARGRNLAELFQCSALALTAIATELDGVEERETYALEASGADLESLLVNWLSEALFLLDGRCIVMRRFKVRELTAERVSGQGFGEPRDQARHRPKVVVKGVTYHQLRVVQEKGGWCAEVFLDI
jgi:SHS2 domain-containing protein